MDGLLIDLESMCDEWISFYSSQVDALSDLKQLIIVAKSDVTQSSNSNNEHVNTLEAIMQATDKIPGKQHLQISLHARLLICMTICDRYAGWDTCR